MSLPAPGGAAPENAAGQRRPATVKVPEAPSARPRKPQARHKNAAPVAAGRQLEQRTCGRLGGTGARGASRAGALRAGNRYAGVTAFRSCPPPKTPPPPGQTGDRGPQPPAIFGSFPSLERNPPEAWPADQSAWAAPEAGSLSCPHSLLKKPGEHFDLRLFAEGKK